MGVIPPGQKTKNKKKKQQTFNGEHLNLPGNEVNVTDITEQ